MQMAAFLCYTIAKTDEFVSSRYMEPDELSVQDSLPGARVQRGAGRLRRPQKAAGILKHRPSRQARPQLFARGKGETLAQ